MIQNILHLLLAIISGILLVVTFPATNMEPVAFIALVPLLSVIGKQKRQNILKSFMLGLITGVVFFGILLFWVAGIRLYQVPQWLLVIGWLFITIVSALFIGVFAVCVSMLKTKVSFLCSTYNIFAPAIIWTALELIRSYFPMDGFPWGILGYSQYQNLILIQVAEFTGVFGISFLIVLVNTVIAGVINRTRWGWYGTWMTAVVLSLCLIWGNIKLQENSIAGKSVAVSVIQTNIGIDQSWEWGTTREKILLMLDRLTKKAAKSNPDLIIWTETAILSSPDTSLWTKRKLSSIIKGQSSYLLIGAPYETDTDAYNSAFLISNKGRIIDRYDKIHLVPFGEMIPNEELFPVLRKIFPQAGMYTRGKNYTVFNKPCKFCTLICYEGIFGNLTGRFVKNGAELMVNITNDAWTRTRAAYYQHFSMDVFRSVENKRYFIRAGNTGISAIINPSGRIEHLLDIDKEGIINARIFLPNRLTFYSQFGDVFACFCLIIAIIGMIRRRN
ncbi:apolipoprotein N-acyltransferase [Candidatus Desantisbacteria bacterium]|nr:apolipoprotein N-acyltransferase [Candidatus Desantisbacteria bacterium]